MAQISSKCDKFYYDNYNSKYFMSQRETINNDNENNAIQNFHIENRIISFYQKITEFTNKIYEQNTTHGKTLDDYQVDEIITVQFKEIYKKIIRKITYVPELFDSTVYLILNNKEDKLNFQSVPTLQQIYVFFNNILPFNISIKTLNYIRTQLENNEIPLLSFRDFINWVGRDFISNYYENKKNDVDTDMKRAIWNLYELVETKYLIIKKMEKIEKELEDALRVSGYS
jgi:hypothetical protein